MALRFFLAAFARDATSTELAPVLQCSELDALARLLAELGDEGAAVMWFTDHARGCKGPDTWHGADDTDHYVARLAGDAR
jgi:hypothetical protein